MYTNGVVEGKLDGVKEGLGRIASAKREEGEVCACEDDCKGSCWDRWWTWAGFLLCALTILMCKE